jgi:superfamily II DNA helicase RecQ
LPSFGVLFSICALKKGHDFRKSYSQLGVLRATFIDIPLIALTATATKRVSASIISSLSIPDAVLVQKSFLRANIRYEVRYTDGHLCGTTVYKDILSYIEARPGQAGIVYVHKRETVEELVVVLSKKEIKCVGYHGGLTPKTKKLVQQQYESDSASVIVATTAFGMGIDKPDVRYVINHSLPSSVEAFYQESGRAGRDGKPSESILYYGEDDARLKLYLATTSKGDPHAAENAVNAMVRYCTKVTCRRAALLAHFGEKASAQDICGPDGCDVCKSRPDVLKRMRKTISFPRNRGGEKRKHDFEFMLKGQDTVRKTPAAEFHSARMLDKISGVSDCIDTRDDDLDLCDSSHVPPRWKRRSSMRNIHQSNKTVAELAAEEDELRGKMSGPKQRIRAALNAPAFGPRLGGFQTARTLTSKPCTSSAPKDDLGGFSSDSSEKPDQK